MNDYTLLAWFAWGALCFIFGAVMMACVRVERGDLDETEGIDMMEDIDD